MDIGNMVVEFTRGLYRPYRYSFNSQVLTKAELLKAVVQKYADLRIEEKRERMSDDSYDEFRRLAFYGLDRDGDVYRPSLGTDCAKITLSYADAYLV